MIAKSQKTWVAKPGEVARNWGPDWGLMRVIKQDPNCVRLEDGKVWRFKVKLEDAAESLTGYAVFEARISDTLGLPKIEDWPK